MKDKTAARGVLCRWKSAAVAFALALALACAPPAMAQESTDTPVEFNLRTPLHLQAARMQRSGGVLRAEGEVKAQFSGYELCAGEVVYDPATGLIEAVEDVRLTHRNGEITGSRATYHRQEGSGEMHDFHTREEATGLRIKGAHAEWSRRGLHAREAEITSCPRGAEDWHLSAGEVQTDEEKQTLRVRNVALHLAGVPVLVLPYGMLYYGNEKRSGFLPPQVQLGSGSGAGVSTPYYFALADNYDFTLTPDYRSQHGLQVAGDFRFLTAQSSGALHLATALGDTHGGRGREKVEMRYEKDHWQLLLDAENVSDQAYLRDYAGDDEKPVRTLPRRAVVAYERGRFFARAAVEHFQSLDDALTAPHRAVPQVDVGGGGSRGLLDWQASAQVADFRHSTLPDHSRMVARGTVRSTRRLGEWAFSPALGVHAVTYGGSARGADFAVPYGKVEVENHRANVFLHRLPALRGTRDHLRLRAAVVLAAEDARQLNAPLLDTVLREQNAENLFEWNRFVGDDRASDSRFIAYGGSYRLFDDAGERFFLAVAQRYNLHSARIALPSETAPPTRGFGNILVNSQLHLRSVWRAAAAAEWNAEEATMQRFYAEVHGEFSERKLLHMRYLQDDGESLILGGAAPIAAGLEVAAQTDYLLNDDQFSRSWLALRLRDSCDCWNISFTVTDSVVKEGDHDTRFSIGMELHGLGGIGNDYSKLLRDLR